MKPHLGLLCHVVKVITKTIGRKSVSVNFLIHQEIFLFLYVSVLCSSLLLDLGNAVPIAVIGGNVVLIDRGGYTFQNMDEQGVIFGMPRFDVDI